MTQLFLSSEENSLETTCRLIKIFYVIFKGDSSNLKSRELMSSSKMKYSSDFLRISSYYSKVELAKTAVLK